METITISAPMTGRVIEVLVSDGDVVSRGDVLVVVESMKMENPILAPVAGKITEINVSEGTTVETGNTLAIIEY